MILRRFLAYFLVAALFAVATTVVFEVYSLRRAADHVVTQNMMFARSVARFVGGLVEQESQRLEALLADLPDGGDEAAIHARLAARRSDMLGGSGVVVFDARRRVLAADGDLASRTPPEVLIPALRQAQQRNVPIVSDLWRGRDGRPRVAVVVGKARNGAWRAVVGDVLLDGEGFQRLFRYFVVNTDSRLQLLDSQGVALFSTRADERYRSVVHGTYFADKVRLGEPVAMPCHSCHETGDSSPERKSEITTVAPVPGTSWSVTVREDTEAMFAPIHEIAYTSVGLVSIILGAFIGFFVLLARRVLKPVQQLVRVAAGISHGDDHSALMLGEQSEFAALAQSLETARRLTLHPIEPGRAGDDEPLHVEGKEPRTPAELREDMRLGLERTVNTVLGGVVGISPVRSAVLVVEGKSLSSGLFRTRGVQFRSAEPTAEVLARIGATRDSITPAELSELGVVVEGSPDTQTFFIQRFQAIEAVHGQLWIGVSSAGDDMGPYLPAALRLISGHIQSLVVRNVLYDQLLQEHEQKNRMVRHLFEAEDEERRRIAREIHDETAQVLNALLLLLETLPAAKSPAAQAERLERAKGLVERLLEQTDRLIRRLRPAVLDDLGLEEAVRTAGHNLLTTAGIDFGFHVDGEGTPLPKEVEIVVYRVFQEAITNVVRHAEATRVVARLAITPVGLSGSIEDNGGGMDLSWMKDPNARPRWGLLGMRERILQLGGSIQFVAPDAGGVRIEFEVPLASKDAASARDLAPVAEA